MHRHISFVPDQYSGQLRLDRPLSSCVPVGLWLRFAAFLLDVVIFWIIDTVLLFFLVVLTPQFLPEIFFVCMFLLFSVLEGWGGTPGKRILGFAIVDEEGFVLGFPGGVVRLLGEVISLLFVGIGFLMIAWDGQKQGLHDRLAACFVVRAK